MQKIMDPEFAVATFTSFVPPLAFPPTLDFLLDEKADPAAVVETALLSELLFTMDHQCTCPSREHDTSSVSSLPPSASAEAVSFGIVSRSCVTNCSWALTRQVATPVSVLIAIINPSSRPAKMRRFGSTATENTATGQA
jgi:hypothetical protein